MKALGLYTHTHTHTHTGSLKENKKKNIKGITLVALVVTIVILLILAGISIQAITNTGLFGKARQATQESKYAGAAEKVALAVNASYDENGKINSTYLKENVNKIEGLNKKVDTVTYDLKIVVDGFEFTISEYGKITGEKKEIATLPENTPQTNAGAYVKMPDSWNFQNVKYIKTTDGTEVTNIETVATVYAVSDGQNNTIPVPNGFYYVGGNLNSGVVISDNENDKNKYAGIEDVKNDLLGNQFVWIQCNKGEFEKQSSSKNHNVTWSLETNIAEQNMIYKYSGFYVGRYEASTTTSGNSAQTNNKVQDIFEKADLYPLNYINKENMIKSAKRMYENSTSVISTIMTGTAWDIMLKTMNKNTEEDLLTTAKEWSNNYDTSLNITSKDAKIFYTDQNKWISLDTQKTISGKSQILTTGACKENKKYNLYEVGGNLWEMTDELATNYTGEIPIYRGSCSWDPVNNYNSSSRGYWGTYAENVVYGFRVMLYLK